MLPKMLKSFLFIFEAATDTATAPTSAPSPTTQTEAAVTVPLRVGERLPQEVPYPPQVGPPRQMGVMGATMGQCRVHALKGHWDTSRATLEMGEPT